MRPRDPRTEPAAPAASQFLFGGAFPGRLRSDETMNFDAADPRAVSASLRSCVEVVSSLHAVARWALLHMLRGIAGSHCARLQMYI